MIESIKQNAELVISVASSELDVEVGFDLPGVEWLDGYISRQHEHGDPANRDGLVSTLGSYFGECIIQSYGGQWAQLDGDWAVRFDEKNAVFPFSKVSKHLENGPEDSVLSMFTTIPLVFKLA